jgi:transcriptional regulator with XRE-family HTH domain
MTTDNSRELVAGRLRKAREQAGLSQAQAAHLLMWHRPTISEIEAARRKVPVEELIQLADLYGVSISWLAGESTGDSRISAVARELEKLKREDFDKVMQLIESIRNTRAVEGNQ